jgi:Arc/MetJ-type ribon-helix-helix transcriptional regulator
MRNIINISLPEKMAKEIDKEVRKENFSTKSEFFRMLVRLWLEKKLYKELEESREELRVGKGKLLKSLKNLK